MKTSKYLFIVIILFSIHSCIAHKTGVDKKTYVLQQIEKGFECIPSRHVIDITLTELTRQIQNYNIRSRRMIANATIDFVLDSDTIIFIETRRSDEIGGFPDYYVYASNYRQVKYYSGLDERKTYTLEELRATRHESLPPKPYPPHWTSKMIEEMEKGSPFPIRDIIFSIQSNSLDSCIVDIGKLNYTPSMSYKIMIAIRVDGKYVFQYFSA